MRLLSRPLAAWIAVAVVATAPCLCMAEAGRAETGMAAATRAQSVASPSCHAPAPVTQISPAVPCDCCAAHPVVRPGLPPESGRSASTPAQALAALDAGDRAAVSLGAAAVPPAGGRSSPPHPPPSSIQVLRI